MPILPLAVNRMVEKLRVNGLKLHSKVEIQKFWYMVAAKKKATPNSKK